MFWTEPLEWIRNRFIAGKVYDENKKLALQPEKIRRLDWGKPVLRIPVDEFPAIWQKWPDLRSTDKLEREIAWRKFQHHDDSLPYRIWHQPRGRRA